VTDVEKILWIDAKLIAIGVKRNAAASSILGQFALAALEGDLLSLGKRRLRGQDLNL